MSSYEITVPPPLPFRQRLRKHLAPQYIITVVFALMLVGFRVMIKDETVKMLLPFADFVLFVVVVMIQYRIAMKEEMYYITHLKLGNETIELFYTKMDEPFAVSDAASQFIFEKKNTLGRTGSTYQSSYLEVLYKNKPLLMQYSSEDWTDMKFIEIVHARRN